MSLNFVKFFGTIKNNNFSAFFIRNNQKKSNSFLWMQPRAHVLFNFIMLISMNNRALKWWITAWNLSFENIFCGKKAALLPTMKFGKTNFSPYFTTQRFDGQFIENKRKFFALLYFLYDDVEKPILIWRICLFIWILHLEKRKKELTTIACNLFFTLMALCVQIVWNSLRIWCKANIYNAIYVWSPFVFFL